MSRRPTEKAFWQDIYLDPKDEVEACTRCHLPDCIPKHSECALRRLLEQKHGTPVTLK